MNEAKSQQSVFVVGGVSWDQQIYLETLPKPKPQTIFSQRTHEAVGSTGSGKALALNRLGIQTTLHALWGDDLYGQRIHSAFDAENLRYLVDIDPKGTERHTNLLDEEGRRISIYTQSATFAPSIDLSRIQLALEACDILALNIINYTRQLIPLAKSFGKPIWCDIHDYDGISAYHRDFVQAADVLFLSSDQMPDYRSFMSEQAEKGQRIVVCTHGKRGATALVDGVWYQQSALKVEAVDSNGAGDNFFAGYLYGYLQGYDPQKCLQMATITAATCVQSPELIARDLSAEKIEAQWQQLYIQAE